jgi:hypothetical protein
MGSLLCEWYTPRILHECKGWIKVGKSFVKEENREKRAV